MKIASAGTVLRDQQRAKFAYEVVASVSAQDVRRDYKIAINDLGANIMRLGLAGAMAALERLGDRGKLLLRHLASAGIPGLQGATGDNLPARVRSLSVDGYILATREFLQVTVWLKRAVQATFTEIDDAQ